MPDHPGVCSSCRAEIKPGWSFCETCGRPLSVSANSLLQNETISRFKNKRVGLVFLIGVFFLCGCLMLIGVAYFTREYWLPSVQAILASNSQKLEQQNMKPPTSQVILQPTLLPTMTAVPAVLPTLTVATPVPILTIPPTLIPTLPIVESGFEWQDDFSSMESGWYVYEDSDGYASYHEGFVFAIAVSQPDYELRSWPEIDSSKPQDDAVMSIKAHRVEGDGYWGMICRYTNQDTYYQLAVDEDQFAVLKYLNGSETYLTSPDWISLDLLDPVQYENGMVPIGFNCTGSSISVTIDGQTVFETRDTSIPDGDVMIYASSYDQKGTVDGYYLKVLFDDFSITLQ